MKRILLVVLFVLFSTATHADGSALLKRCETALKYFDEDNKSFRLPKNNYTSWYSAGYCMGVVHTYRQRLEYVFGGGGYNSSNNYVRECPLPKEVTEFQLIRVLVKHLKDHPETLHYWEASLLEGAFGSAFPCQSENESKK